MAKRDKEVIEYAVEYRRGTKWNQSPDKLYRYMECKVCGQFTPVGEDAKSTTCSTCVQEMTPYEPPKSKQKSDKPRGWQWMNEYVHTDGTVYHKGVEQPELKGKLEPTVIEPAPRLNKKQKERLKLQAAAQVHQLKKKIGKATSKRERKKIQAEINRHAKIARGRFSKKFIQDFLSST